MAILYRRSGNFYCKNTFRVCINHEIYFTTGNHIFHTHSFNTAHFHTPGFTTQLVCTRWPLLQYPQVIYGKRVTTLSVSEIVHLYCHGTCLRSSLVLFRMRVVCQQLRMHSQACKTPVSELRLHTHKHRSASIGTLVQCSSWMSTGWTHPETEQCDNMRHILS